LSAQQPDVRASSHALTSAELNAALPDLTMSYRFAALTGGARIRRDRWGIPHIKADDPYDLYFAQGFATAQDRLFQMDFDRLRALGRSAEYLGPSALQQDRYMRSRHIERVSKRDYEVANATVRQVIDAYTDGVNAFIEVTRALPVEYRLLGSEPDRWQPWHCIAVYKLRNTAEGSFQAKLWLARLAAEIGPEKAAKLSPGFLPGSLLTVPPGARDGGPILYAIDALREVVEVSAILQDTAGGSNGWVLGGDHTASGLPLVAGDAHRSLEAPNVYYQAHLIGADFAALGYAIPGVPMLLHFCHNEHVAWGMTSAGVDTQDLFMEQFRVIDGRMGYLHRGQWLSARVEVESLRARGGQVQQIEIVETHHGPIVAGDPRAGAAIALADPGAREGTPWLDATYRAMRAKSADEFETALESWTDRVNNYVYADVHGSFGYVLRGRIPLRDSSNGWGPVAGWTGQHEWRGCIPAVELPRVRNPATGWIVTCNQRIVGDDYPYYLTNFGATAHRAERIAYRLAQLQEEQLRSGRRATVADMAALHADQKSIPAMSMQKALRRIANASGPVASAVQDLLDWDCVLAADCRRSALYEMTAAKLAERLIANHHGRLADDLLRVSDAGAEEHWRRHVKPGILAALDANDVTWLAAGESWSSVLSNSIASAVKELETHFGTDRSRWRWGDLHHVALQHPLARTFPEAAAWLNPARVELGGDGDTPLLTGSRVAAGFQVTFASVNRYIHDPSHWSNGRWIVPLGASGHPGSPHYCDQQSLWARIETVAQLWDWDEIGSSTESEQALGGI
jgi:penicillin G amidase